MEKHEEIKKFVKDEFPHLEENDQSNLSGSIYLYLDKNGREKISELEGKDLNKFKKYLKSARNEIDSRLVVRVSEEFNDDETLSYINFKSNLQPHQVRNTEDEYLNNIDDSRRGDKNAGQEVEFSREEFDKEKENLKVILSPVLLEAFERGLFSDASIKWTAGFEEQSLKILFWRALMRYKYNIN